MSKPITEFDVRITIGGREVESFEPPPGFTELLVQGYKAGIASGMMEPAKGEGSIEGFTAMPPNNTKEANNA